MKKSEIKNMIKEFIKGGSPQIAEPQIAEPGTETETMPKRRTLRPPVESPDTKPKAQCEGDEMSVASKIGKRFSDLYKDKLDEGVKSRMQKLAGIEENCTDCQKKTLEIKINNPTKTFYIVDSEEIEDILYEGTESQLKSEFWDLLKNDSIDGYRLYSKEEWNKIIND